MIHYNLRKFSQQSYFLARSSEIRHKNMTSRQTDRLLEMRGYIEQSEQASSDAMWPIFIFFGKSITNGWRNPVIGMGQCV